jgi:hypothetical protein
MADNNNRASQLAALLSAVGAAGGWAAYFKANSNANTNGGQLVIPSSLMDLLSAWAQSTDDINSAVAQILAALPNLGGGGGTIPVTVQGYPANADQVDSGQMTVSITLPASLPNLLIPDDFAIVVKAFASNPAGSYILCAGSKSGASGLATAYPLSPNDSISYRVKNASSIWVMATAGPAWVNWTVEQRSS